MQTAVVSGWKLAGALAVLAGSMTYAYAEPNTSARVRAFARLPNWSGIWLSTAWPLNVSGRVPGGEAQLRQTLQLLRAPPYNPEWEQKYTAGLRDTAALAARTASFKGCARAFPALMEGPWMFQLVVVPEETLLVFENGQVRHFPTDGRGHPGSGDLWPTLLGDSVGHWEADSLVVDTISRNASEPIAPRAWVSMLSERAHFTERFRMVGPDDLEDDLTIEDPVALARTWRMTLRFHRVSLNRLIPYDCDENDRNPVVDGKLTITPR